MSHPIIFDVETQHSFQEVGHDRRRLKVSVVGMYDYATDKYRVYLEDELSEFFVKIEHASYIIGFNSNKFDLPVLTPYYIGDIFQFPSLDLLEEVQKALGFRVALDDLARATLKIKKKGHGFLAIDYFKEGKLDKLKKYCLSDVKITKKLYEFGKKNKKLYFQTNKRIEEIPVNFTLDRNKSENNKAVSLSLPF